MTHILTYNYQNHNLYNYIEYYWNKFDAKHEIGIGLFELHKLQIRAPDIIEKAKIVRYFVETHKAYLIRAKTPLACRWIDCQDKRCKFIHSYILYFEFNRMVNNTFSPRTQIKTIQIYIPPLQMKAPIDPPSENQQRSYSNPTDTRPLQQTLSPVKEPSKAKTESLKKTDELILEDDDLEQIQQGFDSVNSYMLGETDY